MSRELYNRFIALCRKWPKDETKVGRDYGQLFREEFKAIFPHGEHSDVKDIRKVDSALSSLERIANNIYFNENVLKRSSASGVEAWACREAVSTEGLKRIQEQEEDTLLAKLKKSLSVKFR